MPTVWLINAGGHDYEPLSNYGTVIPITTGQVNVFNPSRLLVLVASKLAIAEPDDWLAISGAPMLSAVVFTYWQSRFDKANVLQYSVGRHKYVPLEYHFPKLK